MDFPLKYLQGYNFQSRSQWPRRLRRSSAAARLLRLWIRPTGGMDVCLL
jgi:hypothetical protein